MSVNKSRLIKFLIWVTGLVVIDQLVKLWSRNAAEMTEGRTFLVLIPNVFEFKLVFNEGIAFGMAQGAGFILTPIAVAITGYSIYHVAKKTNDPPGVFTALVLLASGAIGNMIDRLFMGGKVTDMFYARFIDFPVFNVADICITFAGALIVLLALKDTFTKPTETTITSEPSPTPTETPESPSE